MTSVSHRRWRVPVALIVVGLLGAWPPPMAAQSAADVFFDETTVHELRVMINSRDWDTLKATYDSDQYYPADLDWGGVRASNVGIRSRGNGSRSGVKPGLRVDIDRYSSGQRFLGLRSFVLRNNTQDASQLRERLSMRLFRQLGLPAPQEAHARLYVNNTFAGVYTIVEAVDRAFLDLRLGESDGYLYDYEYGPGDPPYYFEDRGADASAYVPRPFKPETHERNPRGDAIERLVRVIHAPTADVFRLQIDEVLDVAAFIRHVAVEAFLDESDGVLGDWGMNNFYLYRPASSNRFTIIPWDKSQTFGGDASGSIWRNIVGPPPESRNRLMDRLLEHQDLRERYLDTLLEIATTAAAHPLAPHPDDDRGWLASQVDAMYAQVAPSVHADPHKPHSNEEFEESVRHLRTFAQERSAAVAAEIARMRQAR